MQGNHTSILEEIRNLDQKIWKKYHPDYAGGNAPELYQAVGWLNTDVADILLEFPDSKEDILSIINDSPHGPAIFREFLDMSKIEKEVAVRNNFAAALRSIKKGSELSELIGWGLSKKDIKELAKLHKANRFRKKIEDLLEDCNFHYECSKFAHKEYAEFLGGREKK